MSDLYFFSDRVVSETVCCGTSSPGDDPLSHSPVAPCWSESNQDTPVGCLKRCDHEQDAQIKSQSIQCVLKTLFCSSGRNGPEDQHPLVQGENNQRNHLGDAPEQRAVNTEERRIPAEELCTSKCMEKQFSKSERLVMEVDNCNNVHVNTDVVDCAKRNASIPESTRHAESCKKINSFLVTESNCCKAKLNGNESNTLKNPKVKVVDRIRNYGRLKPVVSKGRSPLKFNRTPVYQYVKRINSCLVTGHLIK